MKKQIRHADEMDGLSSFYTDDVDKKDKSDVKEKFKFLSLRESLGIEAVEISYLNSKTINSASPPQSIHDISSYLFIKEYGSYPSIVSTEVSVLKSSIKALMEFGEVTEIYSRSVSYAYSSNHLLRLKMSTGGREILIAFTDVYKVEKSSSPEHDKEEFLINDKILVADEVKIFYPVDFDITKIVSRLNDCEFEADQELPKIEMIVSRPNGLYTQQVTLDYKDHSTDLSLNYGQELVEFDEILFPKLEEKSKGIVMLHGEPGTGKTHYIRRLLERLSKTKKRIILIPKYVLSSLESPDFNQFMLTNFVNQKTIFIIEDSESVIAKRTDDGGGRSHLVSTILNITDGILNDIFNIQVILTFNTELENIDEALLRKGRLIAKYKFEALNRENSEKLAASLGVTLPENKDTFTLADIYALKEDEDNEVLINQSLKPAKKHVGF